MKSELEADRTRPSADEMARTIRYKLIHELRRVERSGRGKTDYALAIRRVLNALGGPVGRDLVDLIERELARPLEPEDVDEPYAHALGIALAELGDSTNDDARELFSYYLQRLERQGRGEEPFAKAVREALNSNDTSSLARLYYRHKQQEEQGE